MLVIAYLVLMAQIDGNAGETRHFDEKRVRGSYSASRPERELRGKSRRRRGGCSVWRWGRATSSDDEMKQTAVPLAVHAASHVYPRCRPLTPLFIAHSREGHARVAGFELRSFFW